MHHAHERLSRAVEDLATRTGTLRLRVIDVYCDHLSVLSPKEFDQPYRADFEKLLNTLRSVVDRVERSRTQDIRGNMGRTAVIAENKIRERTAVKIAAAIWDLYWNINFARITAGDGR